MSVAGATVFVVDDDPAVLRSIAALLSVRGYRVRTWPSADAFWTDRPDAEGSCLLLDVRMPGMSGIELQRRLRQDGSRLPIVLMTAHADVVMAVAAMRAGAVDFIEKPFRPAALYQSLERALQGSSDPDQTTDPEAKARLALLTEREREVVTLLVQGHTNKAIAYELGISQRTVEVHRARIKEKLKVQGLADLIRLVGS